RDSPPRRGEEGGRVMARAKKPATPPPVSIGVMTLEPATVTRTEALQLAAKYAATIGQIARGKGTMLSAPPFGREFREAACSVGYDLNSLLTVLAEHPEAERFRLEGGDGEGEAWLALAKLYDMGEMPETVDRIAAPLVAALRERDEMLSD